MERSRCAVRDGGNRADEQKRLAQGTLNTTTKALTVLLGLAAGIAGFAITYHVGIALIDGFEFLMKCVAVFGANPFGWSL